jgi:hypothetical protein
MRSITASRMRPTAWSSRRSSSTASLLAANSPAGSGRRLDHAAGHLPLVLVAEPPERRKIRCSSRMKRCVRRRTRRAVARRGARAPALLRISSGLLVAVASRRRWSRPSGRRSDLVNASAAALISIAVSHARPSRFGASSTKRAVRGSRSAAPRGPAAVTVSVPVEGRRRTSRMVRATLGEPA